MLRGEAPFALREDVARAARRASARERTLSSRGDADAELLAALKALRGAIARGAEAAGLCHLSRPHADRDGEGASRETLDDLGALHGVGAVEAAEIRRRVPRGHPGHMRAMPELPEVETVRRGLAPTMVGARIDDGRDCGAATCAFRFRRAFAERLTGRRVVALTRRAKYLLAALDGGETLVDASRHVRLVPHRGRRRAGAFHHPRGEGPDARPRRLPPRQRGARRLQRPAPLRLHGPGRDARASTRHPPFAGLGVEPLAPDFDAARLAALFAGARAPLKTRAARPEAHRRASATSMSARRCTARACRRCARPATSPTREAADRGARRARQGDPRRARGGDRGRRLDACATTARPTASSAISSTPSPSTTARARPARGRAARARSRAMRDPGRSTFFCPVCQK